MPLVFIMIRRRITNGQKLALIEQACQRMTDGDSICSISRDFGIQPQQQKGQPHPSIKKATKRHLSPQRRLFEGDRGATDGVFCQIKRRQASQ